MSAEEEKENDEKGKHQNDFINQRLTWLGTFSSLLFVANGFGNCYSEADNRNQNGILEHAVGRRIGETLARASARCSAFVLTESPDDAEAKCEPRPQRQWGCI